MATSQYLDFEQYRALAVKKGFKVYLTYLIGLSFWKATQKGWQVIVKEDVFWAKAKSGSAASSKSESLCRHYVKQLTVLRSRIRRKEPAVTLL